jgi:preprotein translocase subunit SecD
MKGLNWRVTGVVASLLFCVYLLTPSILKFGWGQTVPRVSKPGDPWYYRILPSEVLTLGLDLQGGLHLVLGIDFAEVQRDAVSKLKTQLQEVADREHPKQFTAEVNNRDEIVVKYAGASAGGQLNDLIVKYLDAVLEFASQSSSEAVLRIHPDHESAVRKRAIDQSLETLRNRIDEFGIAEANIQPQGTDKIQVQFPGVQDPTRIKDIIARTAKLSFQIARSGLEIPNGPPRIEEVRAWIAEFDQKTGNKIDSGKIPVSEYLKELNKSLESRLPQGTEVLFHREMNVNTRMAEYTPYVLDRESMITGEDLQDARFGYDQENNKPEVNFELTPVGSGKFEKATGANVGKIMAIVLDNNVHSAPVIQGRIGGGSARITLNSEGKSIEELQHEATDTSLVLRSGALPARLLFLEERVIGPSLGLDAIRSGTKSLVYGLAIVFAFMLVYYRASGIVASLSLVFNGIIVLACMAAFEATLTLPGLAGLTLTLGMAVDANVLIFEHMREELRNGKSIAHSIAEGYRQAFSAILDGNVTTIFAGLVLLGFGYGPIRGFAVTMLIGLTASMYTAVFVTRVVFDYFVVAREARSLSI